jgi:hypothetical protein
MQQMMIYWQSVVPQHVSGVLTPISRRETASHRLWCSVLAVAVLPESRIVRCVHCEKDVASGWSYLYLLIQDAQTFEHKI